MADKKNNSWNSPKGNLEGPLRKSHRTLIINNSCTSNYDICCHGKIKNSKKIDEYRKFRK